MIYIIESKVGMNDNNQLVDSLMKHKKSQAKMKK